MLVLVMLVGLGQAVASSLGERR